MPSRGCERRYYCNVKFHTTKTLQSATKQDLAADKDHTRLHGDSKLTKAPDLDQTGPAQRGGRPHSAPFVAYSLLFPFLPPSPGCEPNTHLCCSPFTAPCHQHSSTMAPASKVWSFIAFDPATKTMICPPCRWRNVGKNATRGVDHVLKCTASLEANPWMAEVFRPARSSTNGASAVAPVPSAVLLYWRTVLATAMFEEGLPISFFDTAAWRSVFLLASGGTFDGPGSRSYISSVLLPAVARRSDDAVRRHLAAAPARAASIDGATFNHKGVINIVHYIPRPFFIGTARLGTEPSSAVNLRAALTGVLAGPMMAAALPQAQVAGGEVTAMQRFCGGGPQMLVTESPSNMVRMRVDTVRAGAAVFSLG